MFDLARTKAVLWDLDDTLYSRVEAARQTFPGMFRELLYPNRSEKEIADAVDYMMTLVHRNSMIHEDAFRALLEKYPPDKPYVRADCLNYYYANITRFARVFPEQIQVVKKLRARGVKTAIVTNITADRLDSQKRKIDVLGIAELFDAVVISAEIGIHKPDRRIFDYTAKLLGVSNQECLFVGDDPDSDVAGARNADMEVLWIDQWENDSRFDNDPCVHRVRSVLEYFSF